MTRTLGENYFVMAVGRMVGDAGGLRTWSRYPFLASI